MAVAIIHAGKKWNRTGILLEAGKTYLFHARGTWKDWYITCGPAGYARTSLKFFERFRRVPEADWFSIIGAYDGDPATSFDIGGILTRKNGSHTAPRDGELWCFANDLPWMYWNNSGAIELQVLEAASA